MKILSKEDVKDFYDSIQAYGIDKSLIYHRTPELVHFNSRHSEFELIQKIWDKRPRINIPRVYGRDYRIMGLAFCGKVYWLINHINWQSHYNFHKTDISEITKYFDEKDLVQYSLHTSKSFLKSIESIDEQALPRNKCKYFKLWKEGEIDKRKLTDNWVPFGNVTPYNQIESISSKNILSNNDVISLFHIIKSPVFLICPIYGLFSKDKFLIIKNPVLKHCGFQQIKDPFTAYQEIAMFLGGVLVQEDNIPLTTGSDEILAQQKGFDKHSFRNTAPSERKARRKLNRQRKQGKENNVTDS